LNSAKISGDRSMTYVPLTQDHWDVIEYLRDAWFNHNGE
jgi:sulfur relay (sulfurtransferase) DsrC/TusE family protein